jgi:hypothetical protein
MEPIQDDIERIKAVFALAPMTATELDAEAALDRLVAERDELREHIDSHNKCHDALEAERDRLIEEREQRIEVTALLASQKHALEDERDRLIQALEGHRPCANCPHPECWHNSAPFGCNECGCAGFMPGTENNEWISSEAGEVNP